MRMGDYLKHRIKAGRACLAACGLARGKIHFGKSACDWSGFSPVPVLIALILLAVPAPALAGAWTQEEGHGQVILQSSAAYSATEFGPSYDLYASRPYDKVEVTLVFEYGATDWLTLIAAPQFLYVSFGEPSPSSYTGPGYQDVGARMRLWRDEASVVSAQVVGRFPGTGNSESAAAVGYEDPELDLRLLYGLSFIMFGKAAFLDVQLAQRMRFGPPPDELHLDVTLGWRVAERWQLLAQSFNVISEGAGTGPYFGDSYEYYKLQFGAAYDLSAAVTVQLSVVSTVFARNAPQENGVVLAAYYRF
jgi:protein XagA